MKQISATFTKRESELTTTIERVTENMENNPGFPNPPEALAKLKKAQPEFHLARSNAKGRDIKMVSIKNDLKVIILVLLQELADYVTVTSKGDRTLVLSSGFEVSGNGNNNQAPSIGKIDVEAKLPGEATIRISNVVAIKAYIHQYTTETPGLNTVWVGEGSSQNTYTFQGLSSDKRYWFRVVAIGFNNKKAYSPVVSRVIQ